MKADGTTLCLVCGNSMTYHHMVTAHPKTHCPPTLKSRNVIFFRTSEVENDEMEGDEEKTEKLKVEIVQRIDDVEKMVQRMKEFVRNDAQFTEAVRKFNVKLADAERRHTRTKPRKRAKPTKNGKRAAPEARRSARLKQRTR